MFEEAKEWIDSGVKEKIIGFILIFIIVYNLLWGFVEPFLIGTVLHDYGYFHLFFSLAGSTIVYLYLTGKKRLQRLGFQPDDSDLLNSWTTTTGKPGLNVVMKSGYGKVLHIDGTMDDAVDCEIKYGAEKAKKVLITFIPEKLFTYYIKFRVTTIDKKNSKEVWVAFKTEVLVPNKVNDSEWEYPFNEIIDKEGWANSRIYLLKIFKDTYGLDSWVYLKLLGFRIRGTGFVRNITIW
jgi:hypothetical protein